MPKAFSPSQVALGDQCALRAVLGTSNEVTPLVAHPAAAIGRVFHHLLELAVRGRIEQVGTPAEDAERALDRLLQEQQARLASVWLGPVPNLPDVFPPAVWRRKRRVVLDLAVRYLSGALPGPPGVNPAVGLRAEDLQGIGRWSEVPVEDEELRLAGRMDLVERDEHGVTVRDLKTGRVLSDEGNVLPHVERQMQLYGLLARRVWPRMEIRLVVDDGAEHEVSFGGTEEQETRARLSELLDRLPPDSSQSADTLATPGDACEGCAFRHRCPAYHRAAPGYWQQESTVRMPLDSWGRVVEVAVRSESLCNVTMVDAGNRIVKIFGLQRARIDELPAGERLWLFGLRTSDRRRGPGGWRHPRNFFEVADDDPYARAWSLETFTGDA